MTAISTLSKKAAILLAALLVFAGSLSGQNSEEPDTPLPSKITITTNDWLPYINPEGESWGRAAQIIEIIGIELGVEIEWQYMPWDLAYYRIKTQQSPLSFPYLKTAEREKEVEFMVPFFQAQNYFYFNRQFFNAEEVQAELETLPKGKIVGYRYGEGIDELLENAIEYNSETEALLALFSNEIALLPMAESVMKVSLERYFPHRIQLIQKVEGVGSVTDLYLIASKDELGKQLLEKFTSAFEKLKEAELSSLMVFETLETPRLDLATLDVSEGYPVIIGEKSPGDNGASSYYTLPTGTRVIVVEWSEKMTEPSNTDRIYNNMMDMSRVLILNGPLVGEELWVRNMHIQLQ